MALLLQVHSQEQHKASKLMEQMGGVGGTMALCVSRNWVYTAQDWARRDEVMVIKPKVFYRFHQLFKHKEASVYSKKCDVKGLCGHTLGFSPDTGRHKSYLSVVRSTQRGKKLG